ncbi:MAG: IS66 family insertion sequence element accessory protein TnpA [Pseudonocardiaceae bacterium]
MEPIKRIRRSELMWRELLARHATSGMSALEFCRAEGVHPTVFRRWRSRLKGNGKGGKAKSRAAAKAETPFIDIGAVATSRSRFEVRLELGAGMILSIARG